MVYGMLQNHLHRETRRNIHVKTSMEMNKSKKLVIGKVIIVRVGDEIRYNVPEDMNGKQLNELKTKHSEVVNDFIESSKQKV